MLDVDCTVTSLTEKRWSLLNVLIGVFQRV